MCLIRWLESVWYDSRPVARTLLLPLSWLFCRVTDYRRRLIVKQKKYAAPVIVVGNIAVGGTGKTPLTLRLAQLLVAHGYQPGIVSRGYGAHPDQTMIRPVTYHNKPEEVGDEALVLAFRTRLPVVVGIQRSRAVAYLLENYNVDVVLSDDGLQHYKMARDLEIIVLDGQRRCGNGYCLPAGPLRERPSRLQSADFIVTQGEAQEGEYAMKMVGSWLVSVTNPRLSVPLSEFKNKTVHVVTALGNPRRFLDTLQAAGLECEVQLYPDHYLFQGEEFNFDDECPVLMTEKDAVKCRHFVEQEMNNFWYLPVDAQLDEAFEQQFLSRVEALVTA